MSVGLFDAGLALEERLRPLAVHTALIGHPGEAARFAEYCPAILISLTGNQPSEPTHSGGAGLVEQVWTVVLMTRSADDPTGRKGVIEASYWAGQVLSQVCGWCPAAGFGRFVWIREPLRPQIIAGVFYCTLTFAIGFGYAFAEAHPTSDSGY